MQGNTSSSFLFSEGVEPVQKPTVLREHRCSLWSLSGQIRITKEVTKKSRMLLKYTLMLKSKVEIFVLLQKKYKEKWRCCHCAGTLWSPPAAQVCFPAAQQVLTSVIWESIASCSGDQSQERFLEKPRPRNDCPEEPPEMTVQVRVSSESTESWCTLNSLHFINLSY